MPPLRIGIVGCGEAAQVIHLPALAELGGLFEVRALCDASPQVVEVLAAARPGVAVSTDYRDIVGRPDLDAVLVFAEDRVIEVR